MSASQEYEKARLRAHCRWLRAVLDDLASRQVPMPHDIAAAVFSNRSELYVRQLPPRPEDGEKQVGDAG
mgnify:CR=1 FL=1